MRHHRKKILEQPREKSSADGSGLPLELILEILEFFIASLPCSAVYKERITLTLVCQSWRQLVHSCPFMWQRIHLPSTWPPLVPNERIPMVLDFWMKAGDLSMKLVAHLSHSYLLKNPPPVLAKVLRESSSKWRSHTLDFSLDSKLPRKTWLDCQAISWNRLEKIVLKNAYSNG